MRHASIRWSRSGRISRAFAPLIPGDHNERVFRVFVSYTHDSDTHRDRVAQLVQRLREERISLVFDRDALPAGPPEGWPLWSERQVQDADRVLIIATERYRRSYENDLGTGQALGSAAEAAIIRQSIYDSAGINDKFRVVLLSEEDRAHIPAQLQRYHRFSLWEPDSLRGLITWLTGAPEPSTLPSDNVAVRWPAHPAEYSPLLADRIDEFGFFEDTIRGRRQERIILIKAPSNRGKTALLTEFQGFAKALGISNARVDLKGCPTTDYVVESIGLELPGLLPRVNEGHGAGRPLALFRDLMQATQPVLLIFDTYEQGSADFRQWVETSLLDRLERCCSTIVVIAGQTVPDSAKYGWRKVSRTLELPTIENPEDWKRFSDRRFTGKVLPESQIQPLAMATNGEPGLLSQLLETLAQKIDSHGERNS